MLRKIHFLRKSAQQLSSAQLFRTGSQLSSAQQKLFPAQLAQLSTIFSTAQLSSAIFFKICNSAKSNKYLSTNNNLLLSRESTAFIFLSRVEK